MFSHSNRILAQIIFILKHSINTYNIIIKIHINLSLLYKKKMMKTKQYKKKNPQKSSNRRDTPSHRLHKDPNDNNNNDNDNDDDKRDETDGG